MLESTFLSTTIPFVNSRPHVGHALEFVQTDAAARFHRIMGRPVFFLSGSDENSLKNVLAAEREGLTPEALVKRNVVHFEEMQRGLEVVPDYFIKTSSDELHLTGAAEIWRRLQAQGDLYLKEYAGLYCVGCEQFYAEEELTSDGLCPEHLVAPEPVHEENWFFRLSRYESRLLQALDGGKIRVYPEGRLNEVRAFVESGLQDISVSRSMRRSRGWGIRVPGDDSQVMYVWIDALTNYINALGWVSGDPLFDKFWGGQGRRAHVLGKGVIRFHAVYWPAMLMAANLPLPTDVVVHGYMTVDGRKIGKSLGNSIDTMELIDRVGVDAVRYFLLADAASFGDSDFRESRLIARFNNDLANGLGNLVNRVATMTDRYRGGVVPASRGAVLDPDDRVLLDLGPETIRLFVEAMEGFDHREALGHVMALVRATNAYLGLRKPWHLAKAAAQGDESADEQLDTTLNLSHRMVHLVARLLQAHLPSGADRILAVYPDAPERDINAVLDLAGRRCVSGASLFPRLDELAN